MGSKLDPCARCCTAPLSPPSFPYLGPRPTCARPCRSTPLHPPLDWGSSHSMCCTGQPHADSHCRGGGRKGQCCPRVADLAALNKSTGRSTSRPTYTWRHSLKVWLGASGAMLGSEALPSHHLGISGGYCGPFLRHWGTTLAPLGLL